MVLLYIDAENPACRATIERAAGVLESTEFSEYWGESICRYRVAVRSSPVSIRDITSADIPRLFEVRPRTRENAVTLDELRSLGITPDSVGRWLEQSTKGWLWEDPEGQVVGFCMADGSTGELLVIALLPESECRGIGARLMDRAERFLAESGCARAWLTTDLDPSLRAYGFYRRRGWTDWKIEHGLRWMELTLASPGTNEC